ncbi:MAG: YesL family protein [Eubacterium sp.]|nr:YesL family protein [Eubacterium sp.]
MGNVLFSDNLFNRTMTKVFDLFVLGLLTFICCIPIVTGGASITAAYRILLKMRKDHEGGITVSFLKEFKNNLKSSFLGWMLLITAIALLLFDLTVWTASESPFRSLAYGVTVFILVAVTAIADWYFTFRATFEETSIRSLKNAVAFSAVYMLQSIVLGIYNILVLFIATRISYFVILIVVLGFGLLTYPKTIIIDRVLSKYIHDKYPEHEKESLEIESESDDLDARLLEKELLNQESLNQEAIENDLNEEDMTDQ